jgi:hypothetical protein
MRGSTNRALHDESLMVVPFHVWFRTLLDAIGRFVWTPMLVDLRRGLRDGRNSVGTGS